MWNLFLASFHTYNSMRGRLFINILLGLSGLICQQGFAAGNGFAYCVSGTVKDSSHSGAIALVEVKAFLKGGDPGLPVGITSTDSNGHFSLCFTSEIRTLVFTHPGYKGNIIRNIVFTDSMAILGNVMLGQSAVLLEGSGAKAIREKEKIEVDKKTYNVSNNVLSTGGTAVDALRQIPAVNVDAEGNVSLRGSDNVTIYINGKQSSLSGSDRLALLQQIPAANIESIDVNTNPGAKQDAEGVSGIINIVLKKNTKTGKNGYITAGAGDRNKYNATANLNYNNKVWNFSNTISFRQNDMLFKGYNERHNLFNDTSFDIDQYNHSHSLNRNYTWSGSIDYNWSKTLVLSMNYMLSNNRDRDDETNMIRLSDERDSLTTLLRRMNLQKNNSLNRELGLTLRKTFDKPEHNLIAMVNYSRTQRHSTTDIPQNELNTITEEDKSVNPVHLYNENRNIFSNTLVQLDYTKPLKKDKKLETGLKLTARNLDNDYRVDSLNYSVQRQVLDSGKSNHFVYSENVSAVYAMLTHTWTELVRYTAGLRLENTSIFGGEVFSQKEFSRSYTNLFPSGNINFTLQKKYRLPDLQLSYSRRISRPGQWQLNPFTSISDPYNVSRGNPYLKPELTDALELAAYYNTKPVLLTATVYFRQTNSPISRYRIVESSGVAVTSFYNLDYNRSTGAELILRLNLLKDLKMTLNGNLFRFITTGNVAGNNFFAERTTYSGKANLNYSFWKKTELQASFSYMGPMQTAQGLMRSMYSVDMGVKKDIIKDKLSFSLNCTDVFNNRRFRMDLVDPNFTGGFYRKWESRIITFNLTWKFGQALAEKKPRPQEMPSNNIDF